MEKPSCECLFEGERLKVLISGTSGFIGSILAARLSELDHEVYGLERYVTGRYCLGKHPALKTLYADLNDHWAIQHLIQRLQPDIVVHLASISAVSYSYDHPLDVFQTNCEATVNLAETCMRSDRNLKQFIMAGTSEMYGNQKQNPISESARFYPNSPYSASKASAVTYLRYMWDAYGFPVTIMVPFNTYGRHDNKHFIVERCISQMLNQPKGTVTLGDPNPIRDLLYVDDHVQGYLSVFSQEMALGESFNLCTGVGINIQALTSKIASLTEFQGSILWNTIPDRPLDIQVLVGDNSKVKKMFGWSPKVSLDEGLRRTVDALVPAMEMEIHL